MARGATNRFTRSALVGGALVVAITGAGCFGSAHQNAAPSTQALPPPSTVATYAGQAKTCPRPTSYVPKLSPTQGSPGTRAAITGTLPRYGENGELDGFPTTQLVAWWNLKYADRFHAAEKPPKPVPAQPGPVFRILVVAVPTPNPCSYRLVFRVPSVAEGRYPIDILDFGGRSVSSFAPVTFTIAAL
jgi:hypothetical protein